VSTWTHRVPERAYAFSSGILLNCLKASTMAVLEKLAGLPPGLDGQVEVVQVHTVNDNKPGPLGEGNVMKSFRSGR
jgi:hypothetical protein